MSEALKIVVYPDPRLKKPSTPVAEFTPALAELAAAMFDMMRAEKGVGLAAPQIGRNIRLFVMNATGKPEDDRVYVNPVLIDAEGDVEEEEGCLSIPDFRVNVWRAKKLRIQGFDITGQPVDHADQDFVARVWQHETDHLNGILITDRMGAVARIAKRGLLRDLEAKFKKKK